MRFVPGQVVYYIGTPYAHFIKSGMQVTVRDWESGGVVPGLVPLWFRYRNDNGRGGIWASCPPEDLSEFSDYQVVCNTLGEEYFA